MKNTYIFGPVCSRRLGRSLGIDLLPFKTCSYNCVYCECGSTTRLTSERAEFFPVNDVIAELDSVLSKNPALDYVTFAGSGEPTLSLSLGTIITFIKTHYPQYRVAVLTNGSLLTDAGVRSDLARADLVIPTLSSTCQKTFEKIHRPSPGLMIDRIISGLAKFRKEYPGWIWLEVFLVPSFNTGDEELSGLKEAIRAIHPDRIQLNTLDRPATESWVEAPGPSDLHRIQHYFERTGIPVDVIGPAVLMPESGEWDNAVREKILTTIRIRPCTVEDLAAMTGVHHQQISKYLAGLYATGRVRAERGARGVFYSAATDNANQHKEP
ncbi:MAG: radical SAM protein [Methanoregula sp.]|jgi:wyosine [tRNA(Phe)-imidazoG37] synthetase (radical SAM superfamily)